MYICTLKIIMEKKREMVEEKYIENVTCEKGAKSTLKIQCNFP